MDKADKTFIGIWIIGIILVVGFFSFIIYSERVTEQNYNNTISKLKKIGYEIKDVTINSPTIFVNLYTINDFLDQVNKLNENIIYATPNHLYVFNSEFTIGYRVFLSDNKMMDFNSQDYDANNTKDSVSQ